MMKPIKLFVVLLICLPFLSCGNREHGEKEGTTEAISQVEMGLPEKETENHGLWEVSEVLRLFGREKDVDSFDVHKVHDVAYQQEWQDRCEKRLVCAFDSLHPNSGLLTFEKTDSMISELVTFFEHDADESTMGALINGNIQYCFLAYRKIAIENEILRYSPTFRQEMVAWERLEEMMDDFISTAYQLKYFGGNAAGSASSEARNYLLQARVDDLRRILSVCQGKSVSIKAPSLLVAKQTFVTSVDNTIKALNTGKWVKSWDVPDAFTDKEKVKYDSIYHQLQDKRETLINRMNDWLVNRDEICSTDKTQVQNSTAVCIEGQSLVFNVY